MGFTLFANLTAQLQNLSICKIILFAVSYTLNSGGDDGVYQSEVYTDVCTPALEMEVLGKEVDRVSIQKNS